MASGRPPSPRARPPVLRRPFSHRRRRAHSLAQPLRRRGVTRPLLVGGRAPHGLLAIGLSVAAHLVVVGCQPEHATHTRGCRGRARGRCLARRRCWGREVDDVVGVFARGNAISRRRLLPCRATPVASRPRRLHDGQAPPRRPRTPPRPAPSCAQPQPARAAWHEWFSGVVLDELPFDEARLLPRVFANLAARGEAECLPPRLRGKYRWVWTSNQRRCHAVTPALESLRDARIPTTLLKGAALLASGRCAWGAREMGDVDILVPPAYAAEAATVLDAAGWVAQSGVTPDFLARRLVPRRHGWNYARDAPHGNLDLHWHAFEGVRAAAVDAALFERARRVDFGGVELLAFDDIDHVLHVIEHASHGEPAHRLMWVADAAS